jgi:hypothetical protein
MKNTFDQVCTDYPQFFAATPVTVSPAEMAAMAAVIAAVEAVVALPAFAAGALAQAPEIARRPVAARGAFLGYDFHLTPAGPKLIEINTNAGGGLLNACALVEHGRGAAGERTRAEFAAMFRAEWRLERGDAPLNRIAIVDEHPAAQFMAPEFDLFRRLFEEDGIAAVVADPGELIRDGDRLTHAGQPVDLVYNRLTDFSLAAAVDADLRAVFLAGGVVLTPHPRAHALYADKRNLMLLSDDAALQELGADVATRQVLLAGMLRTVAVDPAQGELFWNERKRWFFKPPAGFGGRATYRGRSVTRGVFDEILHGGYLAQELAPPSEHTVRLADGSETTMKADIRCYVYAGRIQLVAARLYQGQVTNFRTPGGGFAPVFVA